MIYETIVRTPTPDIYTKHQYLDTCFRADPDTKREYIWYDLPGHQAILRHHTKIGDLDWNALDSPEAGTKVRFQLRAHVRTIAFESPLINGRRRRVTEVDYQKNIDWLKARSRVIGWELLEESVDMNPVMLPVRKPTNRFLLRAAHFQGIAYIRSPWRFSRALAVGVGNAKAFGLGFIFFSAFGSQK